MDLGWVVTVASPTNPAAQVTIIGNDDPAAPRHLDRGRRRGRGPRQGAGNRASEIAYALRDEAWGVRRFMLREPSGTVINILSHRSG